jgi:1-acyl-sn-glycerol-3-phosphate acyltransferase
MNPGIVRLSTLACSLAGHFCADFTGLEKLPPPPFVLLPKHQSMVDILLEGTLIYRRHKMFPHYLMKHTLPDWLGLYGGIHVVRQRDATPGNDRRKNIAALRRAQQVLAEKGVLVVHPEGTRSKGIVGPLHPAGLSMIVGWQKDLGPLPLVPVGIRYDRQIHVRVGVPRVYTSFGTPELQELQQDIAWLSRMDIAPRSAIP